MDISEQSDRGIAVLAISGRIDGSTSDQAEAAVLQRVAEVPVLVLDFQNVDYISSAGLRVILKAAKASRGTKTRLILSGLTPSVREVFDISGFSSVLEIHPDSQDAVTAALAPGNAG